MNIIHTSLYALDFLHTHLNSRGHVHSVYRRTANLLIDGQLFALQTEGSPLSPISLITDLTEWDLVSLALAESDPVMLVNHSIQVGNHRFSMKLTHTHNLFLSRHLTGQELTFLLSRIRTAFRSVPDIGFAPLFRMRDATAKATDDLVLSSANRILTDAARLCCEEQWQNAALTLAQLIGLGPGLTPAGDDFLCGMLAALRLCQAEFPSLSPVLARTIRRQLSDTNDISRSFLQCALDGQFSQAVIKLPKAAEPTESIDLPGSFLAIGHSSGIDTLCGVRYGLEIYERRRCNHETRHRKATQKIYG